MCGIAGIVNSDPARDVAMRRMLDALAHRGPDGEGIYHDELATLGHRRLSIIDLAGGQQPLRNADRSILLVCNGEIYNYRELRRELERDGYQFLTHSDCEVIIALYERYGDRLLDRLRGMFAFVLWDTKRRRLLAARDHLGQKPLYYSCDERGFACASEIKALLAFDGRPPRMNLAALDQYLALRLIDAPLSMFEGIHKLPPGHSLVLEAGGAPRIERYWHLEQEPKLTRLGRAAVRRARSARRRGAAAAPGERRAGGRIPQRRHGFEPAGRDARAQARRAEAADVHDGPGLSALRRSAGRARGGAAVRHRASRGARDARNHCAAAGSGRGARRAVGSALAVHLAAGAVHAPPRQSRDRRRRRRRAVRRLRPLLRQPVRLALRQGAGSAAPSRARSGGRVDSGVRLVQERRPSAALAAPPVVPFRRRALRREPFVFLFRSRAPRAAVRCRRSRTSGGNSMRKLRSAPRTKRRAAPRWTRCCSPTAWCACRITR